MPFGSSTSARVAHLMAPRLRCDLRRRGKNAKWLPKATRQYARLSGCLSCTPSTVATTTTNKCCHGVHIDNPQ